MFTCSTIPNSLWIDSDDYKKILCKLEKQKRTDILNKWIKNLDEHYYNSLKKIIRIINIIKNDIDKSISCDKFDALEIYTKKVLNEMNTLCEIYYLLAINFR